MSTLQGYSAFMRQCIGAASTLAIVVHLLVSGDKTYVASANNITNTINPATGAQFPGNVLAMLEPDRSMPARLARFWPA
jgi:hypothetical protein